MLFLQGKKVKNTKSLQENKSENNTNKTPSKMARLAWPKAKYGAIIAVLIIIVINLIYYKDFFLSFFN